MTNNYKLNLQMFADTFHPVYKRKNGAWILQTAYQFLDGEWVLISKTSVPIGLNIPVIVDGVEVKQVLVDGTEITNIIIE